MSAYTLAENAPLTGHNTFRVAARARLLADVRRAEGLAELFAFPMLEQGPVLVLGEGSNVLLVDDVPGVVVTLSMRRITVLDEDARGVAIRAEAGVVWHDFVQGTLGRGLVGLENLSLIPGTVGAAPIQNIGAYGAEVGECIEAVEAFDREGMQMVELDRDACRFGYRDSVFKQHPERWVITAVRFRLPRQAPLRLDYAGIRDELDAMGIEQPRASEVAEAVIRLRSRKLPNPDLLGNAGSFFKNPTVDAASGRALAARHPGLPVFPSGQDGTVKLSAAWLIEACGWKGFREGDAGVAEQHALVLVNHGSASGRELLDLARRIVKSVHARFGLTLEPEPRIIGAEFADTAA